MGTLWITCKHCGAKTRLFVGNESGADGLVEFLLEELPTVVPCVACPVCDREFPRLTRRELKAALAKRNWS